MRRVSWSMFFVLAVMLVLVQQRAAHAGTVFFAASVSLDTSALSGPFELVFVLTDGSGIGDANNLVELNDFTFGAAGSAGSVDTLLSTGGASGDLTTGVALVDTAFFNVFASSFTPAVCCRSISLSRPTSTWAVRPINCRWRCCSRTAHPFQARMRAARCWS